MAELLFWLVPLCALWELCFPFSENWPHPVAGLGSALKQWEGFMRSMAPGLGGLFGAGFIATLLAVAVLALGISLLMVVGGAFGFGVGVGMEFSVLNLLLGLPCLVILIYLCYSALAMGHLLRAGLDALETLERGELSGNLQAARFLVGQLVSRDVSEANVPTLYRTLAETLSENFNDAFVSPLFWFCVGGPVGLWCAKCISTMDSMWGYRTERWEKFGKTAARLDDVLAFVPARLSALLLRLTYVQENEGHLGGAPGGKWPGWAVISAQARTMQSPNAGWPMAAAAWLHHGRMGGPAVYFGKIVEKPMLGPNIPEQNSAFSEASNLHIVVSDCETPVPGKLPQPPSEAELEQADLNTVPAQWDAERLRSLLRHLRRAAYTAIACATVLLSTVAALYIL